MPNQTSSANGSFLILGSPEYEMQIDPGRFRKHLLLLLLFQQFHSLESVLVEEIKFPISLIPGFSGAWWNEAPYGMRRARATNAVDLRVP